jgi:hypothetical protein
MNLIFLDHGIVIMEVCIYSSFDTDYAQTQVLHIIGGGFTFFFIHSPAPPELYININILT